MHTSENCEYKQEVQQKWGHTPAYTEYKEKTENHSVQTCNALADQMERIMQAFAECMLNGETPDSATAQTRVKTLQNHITEHYYHCTNEILAGLGQMYVCDERFKYNIDKHADGTAHFVSEAIAAFVRT